MWRAPLLRNFSKTSQKCAIFQKCLFPFFKPFWSVFEQFWIALAPLFSFFRRLRRHNIIFEKIEKHFQKRSKNHQKKYQKKSFVTPNVDLKIFFETPFSPSKASFFAVENVVFDVETTFSTLKNDVFDVENGVFDIENGVFDIENDVFDVENDVFDIENDVFDVENDVFDVENDVFDVENNVRFDVFDVENVVSKKIF